MPASGFNFYRLTPRRTVQAGWTIADIQRLRTLAGQGVAPSVIANVLGRTTSAVKNKAGMHGISLQARSQRDGRSTCSCESLIVEGWVTSTPRSAR